MDNDNDITIHDLISTLENEYQLYVDQNMNTNESNASKEMATETPKEMAVEVKETPQKPIEFKLEIERKFLLKNIPMLYLKKRKHELINIEQYYFFIDGIWERYRVATDKVGVKHIRTIKRHVSPGVCEEGEVEITRDEFEKVRMANSEKRLDYKLIQKTRFVIEFKGLKFEIDVYQGMRIVTMEVELPSIDFIYSTPKELQECILMDLTGMKEFSNLSLATTFKIKGPATAIEGKTRYDGDY